MGATAIAVTELTSDQVEEAWATLSRAEQLALAEPAERRDILADLTDEELLELSYDWYFWGRPKQLAPPGAWGTWMIRAGRGFGKTRSGVGWIQERAFEEPHRWIALVAKTPADARDFMIEGPGGFLDKRGLNVAPAERPEFQPSKRRLTWPNGSWATIFSDEDPEQLRGFSGDTAWLDEFGKFKNPREVWDNLNFGMREASVDRPRRLITTTPRPLQIIKDIEARATTTTVNGSSYENRSNLDPSWFAETILAYEGTRYGDQEIYGDILDLEEVGIVKRAWFRLWPRQQALPKFEYIIVSLDTAFTEKTINSDTHDPDPTACGVYGLFVIPGQDHERRRALRQEVRMGILILDCWQDFLGFPDLLDRARRELKVRYGQAESSLIKPLIGPAIGYDQGRRPDLLVIEDVGSGRSLRQVMAREGIPAYAYNPGNLSKLQRLHLISHVVRHGYVYMVESEHPDRVGLPKSWVEPLLAQVCSFVGEGSLEHDDHVDQFTQALRVMLDTQLVSVLPDVSKDLDPHRLPEVTESPFGQPLINPYAQ